jgi:hypothetical protein
MRKMQLQVNLLVDLDALMAEDDPGHHHDHMDGHDHAKLALTPIEAIERPA